MQTVIRLVTVIIPFSKSVFVLFQWRIQQCKSSLFPPYGQLGFTVCISPLARVKLRIAAIRLRSHVFTEFKFSHVRPHTVIYTYRYHFPTMVVIHTFIYPIAVFGILFDDSTRRAFLRVGIAREMAQPPTGVISYLQPLLRTDCHNTTFHRITSAISEAYRLVGSFFKIFPFKEIFLLSVFQCISFLNVIERMSL